MFETLFAGDSFLTLTPWERAGAAGLSLLLGAVLIWVMLRLPLPRWWRVLAALALFWLFLWLGPQAYYAYYLMIFDDLPLQWVIRWPPPGRGEFGTTLLFLGGPDLADIARGALGWALVLAGLIPRGGRR